MGKVTRLKERASKIKAAYVYAGLTLVYINKRQRLKWGITQFSSKRRHIEKWLIHFWNPLLKAGKIGYAVSQNLSSVMKIKAA